MIKISNKQDCCGCTACKQKCPQGSISMVEDEEGFIYPKVDKNTCVDCGICEIVCPFANKVEPTRPISVMAVKNRNERERIYSSSGGVFISLAHEVIESGGVVFGVCFDGHWNAEMRYAETMDEVLPMMGSKYIQATMGNAYRDAERFLKTGRNVLFSGCPCQIAGLKRFLQKEYPNLLSLDLICGGVPSHRVWRSFLKEDVLCSTQIEDNTLSVTSIKFRDKTKKGWKNYSFVVQGKSLVNGRDIVLMSSKFKKNPFGKGFLSKLYVRPSCHACRCKKGKSRSDITIGDFWGIDYSMLEFNDNKGVSIVLLNTQKGQEYIRKLDVDMRVASMKDVMMNDGVSEYLKVHPKRELFFSMYSNGIPVSEAVKTCLHVPLHIRLSGYVKNYKSYMHVGMNRMKNILRRTISNTFLRQ